MMAAVPTDRSRRNAVIGHCHSIVLIDHCHRIVFIDHHHCAVHIVSTPPNCAYCFNRDDSCHPGSLTRNTLIS